MRDPFYRTPEWRALRSACLERDGYRCTVPGCGSTDRLTADHITPRRRGGPDTLDNLRTLCGSCHSRVTRQGNTAPPRAIGCDVDGTPYAVLATGR